MMNRVATCVAIVVCCLTGCDKAGGKSSGALSGPDLALFKDLPAGASLVLGGNYLRMQKFMTDSALAKQVSGAMGKGVKDWSDCFLAIKNVGIAGSLSKTGSNIDARLAMSGVTIANVTDCAAKAGYKATADADGKYISVDVESPAGSIQQGYLKLPDGALYFHQSLDLHHVSTRADLEAEAATLAKGSVLDDPKLAALAAKPNRDKTMWFAGTAAGTPLADKIGDAYGSIDFDDGLALDLTAQIMDSALASKIEDGLKQAKSMADKLPGDLKDVIKSVDLRRDGNTLHGTVKVSEKQLTGLMNQSGGMFGGGGPH